MAVAWNDVQRILKQTKTIAVVGLSDKPDRDSYQIASYLQQQGYRIIPVNPRVNEVLGEKAYPSLRDVPEPVDVVDIFRRSEDVPPIVEDAIAIGAKVVWMQAGIVNEEAAARAEAAGLAVIMNACMRSAHRTLRASGRI
jgi:predicted CoA-binding protein